MAGPGAIGLEPVLHQVAKPSAGPQTQSQVGVPLQEAGNGAQLGMAGGIGSPDVPPMPILVPLQAARQYSFAPHVFPPQPTRPTAPAAPAMPADPAALAPAAPPTWEVPASPPLAVPA